MNVKFRMWIANLQQKYILISTFCAYALINNIRYEIFDQTAKTYWIVDNEVRS